MRRMRRGGGGVSAVDDKMCDPVGQSVGLARSGTRNDQQRSAFIRADTMLDGPPLLLVQI